MHYRKTFIYIGTLLLFCFWGSGTARGQQPGSQEDVFFLYNPGVWACPAGDFHGTVQVSAAAAVLMDADTGQVLYAKNPHQRRPIASTTKIMTALLAIECGDLKDVVTVNPRAVGVEGSSIYLTSGEKLELEELVYGALMNSGNDACVAIAEYISGGEKVFVEWMNLKAARLGLKDTRFSNTNGLPHREHFSTAYDLAVITRDALKNPVFNRVVSTRSHVISGPKGQRLLSNTNKMLWSYKGADGVKTGTTNAAGRCLVSSASREGRRLVSVVLHSDDRYQDSIRLLDYGFSEFASIKAAGGTEGLTSVCVAEGVKNEVSAGSFKDIMVTVPVDGTDSLEKIVKKDSAVKAPVKKGQVVGSLLVLVDGSPVAEADLVTRSSVDRLPVHRLVCQRIYSIIKKD